MKTETVLLVGVLVIGGLIAYKLIAKNQIQNAYVPLGANVGTLNAAANAAGKLLPAFENLFSGSSNGFGQVSDPGYSDMTD